jgi:hypothetical protein
MARVTKSDYATEKEYYAAYMRARYVEDIAWLQNYKVEKGCMDCGYNAHHAGLEFDHRIPRKGKTKAIAGLVSRGRNTLLKEIDKCDVVCKTCHGVRTWTRLQEEKTSACRTIGRAYDS